MKIVFMGTPDFAVPTLEALIRGGHQVAAVVTQPDKPKGRGKAVLYDSRQGEGNGIRYSRLPAGQGEAG